jgi:superfamily II DNA helicase RecQ
MMYKVLTIQADPHTGVFSDTELQRLSRDYQILSCREHFYVHQHTPTMVLLIEYRTFKNNPKPKLSTPRKKISGRRLEDDSELNVLPAKDQALYEHLRAWRKQVAIEQGISVINILHNAHLLEIVRRKPTTKTGLQSISGIGKVKADKYAAAILAILHQTPEATITASMMTEGTNET